MTVTVTYTLTRDDVCLAADLYVGSDEVGVLLVHPDGDTARDRAPALPGRLAAPGDFCRMSYRRPRARTIDTVPV